MLDCRFSLSWVNALVPLVQIRGLSLVPNTLKVDRMELDLFLRLAGIMAVAGLVLGPLMAHAWPGKFDPLKSDHERIMKRK